MAIRDEWVCTESSASYKTVRGQEASGESGTLGLTSLALNQWDRRPSEQIELQIANVAIINSGGDGAVEGVGDRGKMHSGNNPGASDRNWRLWRPAERFLRKSGIA